MGILAALTVGAIAVFGCCGLAGIVGSSFTLPTPAPPEVPSKSEIAKGYNRGENDLEGRKDSTEQEPILAAAKKALEDHFGGKVTIDGTPKVGHIVEAGKSWVVEGRFHAPADSRNEFQSIVRREADGGFVAGNLMLGDDVVMDNIAAAGESAGPAGESSGTLPAEAGSAAKSKTPAASPVTRSPLRVWRAATGNYQVKARYVSADAETVKLEKESGDVIDVKIEKLCDLDQRFVSRTRRQAETKSPPK